LDPYLRNTINLPENLESRRNPRNAPRTPLSNSPFPARSAATTLTIAFPRAPIDRQNSRRSSRVKVGEEEGRERGKNRARVCHKNTGTVTGRAQVIVTGNQVILTRVTKGAMNGTVKAGGGDSCMKQASRATMGESTTQATMGSSCRDQKHME
ncbi:hypothetical protein Taro_024942, partial [Colocasia esculenta]|nr:hypothetical protein [Colocasia esculenta]